MGLQNTTFLHHLIPAVGHGFGLAAELPLGAGLCIAQQGLETEIHVLLDMAVK